jgi:hypothetical protein
MYEDGSEEQVEITYQADVDQLLWQQATCWADPLLPAKDSVSLVLRIAS